MGISKEKKEDILSRPLSVWCPFIKRFTKLDKESDFKPENFRMCLSECPLARKNRVEGAIFKDGIVQACTKDGSVMQSDHSLERDEENYE